MRVFNVKKEHILSAFNAVKHLSDSDRITLLTNFGYVVASIAEIEELDFSTEENIINTFKTKNVDMLSFIANFNREMIRRIREEENWEITDRDKVIYLKDAIIYSHDSNQVVNVPMMSLFVDQIVGVIPGEFKKD
ncbi:hypothetical protein [Thermoflavimicrobium dichotomicum]|uniref:Uncharacterized protein n=1 Tax=Thermoflavimicrobium dichotomicum TaxID=46223 RepID=A0A1I3UJ39_9BACL|nr:hypothetical protein [Thermoflavimicrobium dichotomicum]SFJ82932.1 hypothetical protein SAMN05421852_12530 [Thermoflavimicrobium dichotomicum]